MPDFQKKVPIKLPDPKEVKELTLELERAESFGLYGIASQLSGYTESLRKELELEKNKNKIDTKEYQQKLQELGKNLSDSNTYLTNTEIALRTTRTTAVVVGATIATGGVVGGTIAVGGVIAGSTAVVGTTATAIAAGTVVGTIAGVSGNIVEAAGHVVRGNKTSSEAIQNALDQSIADLQATATSSAGMIAGMGFAGKIIGPITSLTKRVLFGSLTGSGQAVSSQLINTGINTASGREKFSFHKSGKELLQNGIVGLFAGFWGAGSGVAREGMKSVTAKGSVLALEVIGDLGLGLGSAKTFATLEGRDMTFEEIANEVSGSIVGSVAGEIGSASRHKISHDNSQVQAAEATLLLARTTAKLPKKLVLGDSDTTTLVTKSRPASIAEYPDLILQVLEKLTDIQLKIEDNEAKINHPSSSEFPKLPFYTRWKIALVAQFAERKNRSFTKEVDQVLSTFPTFKVDFFRPETSDLNLLKKINNLANNQGRVCSILADRLLTDHYQWALANPEDSFSQTIFAMAELRIGIFNNDNATLARVSVSSLGQLLNQYSVQNIDPETRIIDSLFSQIVKEEKSNVSTMNNYQSIKRIKQEINSPGTVRDLNIFEKMTLERCELTKRACEWEYTRLLEDITYYSLTSPTKIKNDLSSPLSSKEVKVKIAEFREKLKNCVKKGNLCGGSFEPDIEKSIKTALDLSFRKEAATIIDNIYDRERLDNLFESFHNRQPLPVSEEFELRFKEFKEKLIQTLPEYESLLNELRNGRILPNYFKQRVSNILPDYPKVFQRTNPLDTILRKEAETLRKKYEIDLLKGRINQLSYDLAIKEMNAQVERTIKDLRTAWNENRAYTFHPEGELIVKPPN